jgi:hypothetical protein
MAEYGSKNLDHLGLVAGMFDELGVGMMIDDVVPQMLEKRKVSVGEAVKAIQSSWTNGGLKRPRLC